MGRLIALLLISSMCFSTASFAASPCHECPPPDGKKASEKRKADDAATALIAMASLGFVVWSYHDRRVGRLTANLAPAFVSLVPTDDQQGVGLRWTLPLK